MRGGGLAVLNECAKVCAQKKGHRVPDLTQVKESVSCMSKT